MKTIVVTFFLSLAAMPAWANFDSMWFGKGSLTGVNMTPLKCDDITFEVRQSNLTLSLKYGYILCGPHEITVRPYTLRIHGIHLVSNGTTIGTLLGDKVHLDYINQNGLRVVLDAAVVGQTMSYSEQWFDSKGMRTWFIQGQLAKQ